MGERFDGVLMDMQMPIMDGLTATREIRKRAHFANLPIIAMTANIMASDQQKHLAAGANDHIAKPINPEEMIATLARWITPLHPAAPAARAGGRNSQAEEPLPDLQGVRVAESVNNIGGSLTVYFTLIGNFRNNQKNVTANIRAALSSGDRKTAERLAHTLKGLAGTIGADALMDKSRELELAIQNSMEGDIEPLLSELELELSPLFAAIDRALRQRKAGSAEAVPAVAASPVDFEAIARLVARAKNELEEFDSAASLTLLEIDRAVSPDDGLRSALQDVLRSVEKYDYERGLAELLEWDKGLKRE
jgi:two-component system, sensor histidine kinase and response regulator